MSIYLFVTSFIAVGLFDIFYSRKARRTTRRRDDLIAKLLPKGIYILLGFSATLYALKFFGVDTKSILASMGIGGIALSFAFAPLIKSILSGIKILITAPFNLGQYVKVAGHEGIVERIGFTTINIRTGTGSLVTLNTQTVDGT
ncbi:MAG: mechanosensitive ion channel, partial [Candidatus Poribacteria bacterium]|nr:mechanosensitive ion channel [Candidatus Poribacteria bacterium]